MRFSVAASFFFAVAVTATPALVRRGCEIMDCIVGLAPTVETCASAALASGSDIVNDFNCLLDAYKTVTNFPSDCSGCFDDLWQEAENAASEAGSALEQAGEELGNDASELWNSIF